LTYVSEVARIFIVLVLELSQEYKVGDAKRGFVPSIHFARSSMGPPKILVNVTEFVASKIKTLAKVL